MSKSSSFPSDRTPPAGKRARRRHVYTLAKADAVIEAMRDGISVRAACRRADVANSTFLGWVRDDVEGLADRYARAQWVQAVILFDECHELADDSSRDWIVRTWRDGQKRVVLNTSHLRRVEVQIAWRHWYFAQVQSGAMARRREAKLTDTADVVAACRRLAERHAVVCAA